MTHFVSGKDSPEGWGWFDTQMPTTPDADDNELFRSFTRCFKGADGALVLAHLKRTILDRRLGPRASDAELRFLEGQRSVVAHIISALERH